MKKIKNLSALFVLILCAIIFYSCFSVNRQIKLNRDGSGKEDITIKFSKDFYEIMTSLASLMDSTRRQGYLDSLYSDEIFISGVREKYDSIQGIKITDITSAKGSDSSNSFTVKYEFDSVQKISTSLNTMDGFTEDNKTKASWNRNGDQILFEYTYENKDDIGTSDGEDSLSGQMMKGLTELFQNDTLNFEIEFPYEVISSNATSVNGNLLKWSFPVSEIFTIKNIKLEAAMKEN